MSDSEAEGKILRELGLLRRDFQTMAEQADQRHRTTTNDILEARHRADRAIDIANDAKRVADALAIETRDMQRTVIEHTKGLGTRVAGIETGMSKQDAALDALLAAETERKVREDEREKQDERRWKSVGRWAAIGFPVVGALGAIATWLITHWKP